MSHFTVVVFTKDRENPEQDVERLLAPFDENDDFFGEGSFWDWWVIGGRWDGAMLGRDPLPAEKHGFRHGDQFHTLARNACEPQDMNPDFVPFGFVTPDGDYYSNGTMGWFAMVEGGEDEEIWKQKWIEAKGAFANTLAVLTDCHV